MIIVFFVYYLTVYVYTCKCGCMSVCVYRLQHEIFRLFLGERDSGVKLLSVADQ
ncbi:hypothetical protein HanRHA438_Chr15g0704611 [Helianthus annuus]|nr:hypothetical protein HanRHA438_Chr15g0704611 [Helianthus annuus]